MAEQIKNDQPKVLLTQDEEGKLKAVTGVDEKSGKLKTADPTRENADGFLKFDTRGNPIENFIKKFSEQSNGEPLKPGQTRPTEKQAEKREQRQSPSAPRKGRGRSV